MCLYVENSCPAGEEKCSSVSGKYEARQQARRLIERTSAAARSQQDVVPHVGLRGAAGTGSFSLKISVHESPWHKES